MAAKSAVRVRMYRLDELGDCFLVSFLGGSTSHMLIDCGSFRNSKQSVDRLRAITADIRRTLDGARLDVVVGTHQHNDHLSGFVHCEETFRAIGIDRVWLSWLDDPANAKARKIGENHKNLRQALAAVSGELHLSRRTQASKVLGVVDGMLGFFGATESKAPELPANAISILKGIGRKRPVYLNPGSTLDMPGLPSGTVRIHVLGPPTGEDDLYRKDPKKGESYDHALANARLSAANFLNAVKASRGAVSRTGEHYPFAKSYKFKEKSKALPPALREVVTHYRARSASWRTIDDDWLDQAEGLALFMDSFTNNSSLALAIELCGSGKVLLFAADAQTGNWSSWKSVKWEMAGVKTDDLLARTVLYKVGHHASHNATLVELFEKMNDPGLSALIPVHKKDPNIVKSGWKMPARKLFKRIAEKTSNRVLQMDNKNPAQCTPQAAKKAWKGAGIIPKVTDLYIELEIEDA
jgi:hypothetical protein